MPDSEQPRASLYRRALGADYERLPGVLRTFHDLPDGGAAEGTFKITRGRGALRNLVADAMRLPPAAESVLVHLQVVAADGRERWIRDFGAHRLVTEQWMDGDLLVEAAGPIRFLFRLTATEHGMEFDMERCRVATVPLAMAIAPRVSARLRGLATSWQVTVQVDVPILGMVVRYEGEMSPLEPALGVGASHTVGASTGRNADMRRPEC
jgi:hypothetical protein